jgi:type I restriction enzyme M protein
MPVKKSDLYRSLWKSCDELRGGMDASQYKDYVLVLLFVKYVSDKAASQPDYLLEVPEHGSFAALTRLKGQKDIGDRMNTVIGALAEANELQGVIDVADWNDPDKLGRGQEMVDRLSRLVGIFENPALDFGGNRAEGDDLLGDAYEYLMRHFATESGKSKGQFYTPAEVSRIMAQVIGVGRATSGDQTIHDPACGSGSLLIKAHDEALGRAGVNLALYGQEMDNATRALALMNMYLHDCPTAVVEQGNTLATPHFVAPGGSLKTFDFVVANPPFSSKSWSNGVQTGADPFHRFDLGVPPQRNGDYAFLLHILACLKSTGKGAVILPHGVLFRGNAEGQIRREVVRRGYIKGIIGLPPNLFYGTGIPACIVVLDKEHAHARTGIFMVDASRGFRKDGNKNRLRAQDIHRIVDTFARLADVPGYARMVPLAEIADPRNGYNLNLPRYVDAGEPEDVQDLDAHMRGGIPDRDLDALGAYWEVLPAVRSLLYESAGRPGYSQLRPPIAEVRAAVLGHPESARFEQAVHGRFAACREANAPRLMGIAPGDRPKVLIEALSEGLLVAFRGAPLLDAYHVYQHLMDYWAETMQDDAYLVAQAGWREAAKPRPLAKPKKGEKRSEEPDFTLGVTVQPLTGAV